MPSRHPTQYVNLARIGQRVRKRVRRDFQEGVRPKILEVVDVGLDHDTLDPVDGLLIVFMERQLDVGFAELNLLPASGGAG